MYKEMTPYTLAKLLHETYPGEFGYPVIINNCCHIAKSGENYISNNKWNPLTEPRDFVPLLVRFAGDLTDAMDTNSFDDDTDLRRLQKFWSTITPTSFCTELEEYLKERVNG